VRYLGIPASNIATTAYRTVTDFTATAGQTTFTPPSYTAGFINVYRNGARLGAADYTATNGTTVVLATGATAGDLVTTESFFVSSVLNAIPATNGAVTTPYILDGAVTAAKMGANGTWAPAGTVIQVVSSQSQSANISTTSTSYVTTNVSLSITPKFATSSVLLLLNANLDNSASGRQPIITFYKGASNLASTRGINQLYSDSSRVQACSTSMYLDSPATTSSTTYTVYFKSNGGGSVSFATDNLMTSFILMEIAA
jgi:hypothetical protein